MRNPELNLLRTKRIIYNFNIVEFMKRGCFLVLLILALQFVSANEFGYDAQELVIDLEIYSRLHIIPEGPSSDIDYVNLYLTYFPRESWQQDVLSINSNKDYKQSDDALVFSWIKPSERILITNLTSRVKVKNDLVKIKNRVRFPLSPLGAEFDQYIKPTPNIDSNDPEIIELASSLAAGQDDEYFVIYELFRWVRENINYSLNTISVGASQPSSWVLENRYGVCDELNSLFIALVRSVGIPARYVSGVAYTNYNKLNRWGAHGWAEIYFPDYGWVPFDVTYGEFAFVDPTHIILKQSLDSNESSLRYEWKSRDVKLNSEPMVIEANLDYKRGKSEPLIQIELSPIITKIKFGSYNIIRARVKNLKDYYVATELTISQTNGLETISEDRRDVLLKPNQEKSVYWLVKVSEDLNKNFLYTFPVSVVSTQGVEALSSFQSSINYQYYSLQEMSRTLNELKEEEELTYSENIDIDCSVEKNRFYIYESTNAVCDFRNSGNVILKDLKACLGQDCRVFTLGISRDERVIFPIESKDAGEFEKTISVKNLQVSKTAILKYTALDLPDVDITNLEFPKEVEYDGGYELKFTVKKNSTSNPQNITITVESNIPKEFRFSSLDEERNFVLGFKGGDLDYGVNNIKINALYYDLNGRVYKDEKTVSLSLTKATIIQRIIILLKNIEVWLEKTISKI